MPQMNLVVDGEVNQQHKRAFKGEHEFTNASMAALIREARDDYLKSEMVKEAKNRVLQKHTLWVFSNFIKEKKIVWFKGMCTFTKLL